MGMATATRLRGEFRLGRYRLETRLAVGGMAEVWRVRQEGPAGFEKQLVLKKLLPHLAQDADFVRRFLDEARYAALLDHPNVVQIFELGEDAGTYFLVMEYLRGRSLREVLREAQQHRRSIPVGLALQAVAAACDGLHYAHELKVEERAGVVRPDPNGRALHLVHRDVSPENVLVGESGQVKVVDFGIARAAGLLGGATQGAVTGKLSYMAPEQLLALPVDRRADVFALGVLLYELLTGRLPFDRRSGGGLRPSGAPPLPIVREGVSKGLSEVVLRALRLEPDARPQSALALASELREAYRQLGPESGDGDWGAYLARFFPQRGPRAVEEAVAPGTDVLTGRPAPAPSSSAAAPEPPPAPVVEVTVASSGPRRRSWALWGGGAALVASLAALAGAALWGSRARPVEASADVSRPRVSAPAPPSVGANIAAVPAAPSPEVKAGIQVAAVPAPSNVAERAVPAERSTAAPVAPRRRPGFIALRVHPWADVILDGRAMGVTPMGRLEVSPGRRRLRLVNAELGKTVSRTVEVKAGREHLIEVNLTEE